MSNPQLQASRELGTILAALNLWFESRPKVRESCRMIATDGEEFKALTLPEVTALIDRLNMGGYVSPSETKKELGNLKRFEKGCLEMQMQYWINQLQTLLNDDTIHHLEDLETSMQASMQITRRINETAQQLLTYK